MKIKVPREITLPKFARWIREYTRCEIRMAGKRLNVVVQADNIAPGCCVPLYAEAAGNQVLIYELAGDFHSSQAAWQALESGPAQTYPPVPFHQWAADQYLTARHVKIEQIF
ncbi:MAG: hypothetical protein ACOX6I_09855 [Syntrophomonadaceae bacterium]|jgi:hypothetical protein